MSFSERTIISRIIMAIKRRFDLDVRVPTEIPGQESLAKMNERSVCRNYKEIPLDIEVINLLCATALSAPSKSDLQQATIIRIQSPTMRSAIQDLIPGSPWIAKAPEFFMICGDHSRLRHIFKSRGSDFPNNHLDSFFNASVDAGIVLATFVQAANFAGLGSCPVSEIRDHIVAISSLLELPKYVFPVVGLTLGYPESYEPLSPRLGLRATIHNDKYESEFTETELNEYDKRRIRDRPYSFQRETSRFGEASQYGWTEEKYRQYSNEQRKDFGSYVRLQGFSLD